MYMDNKDTRSFNTSLDKTLRENPKLMEQVIDQYSKSNKQEKTQSASRGR
jgi:hypothetical protein